MDTWIGTVSTKRPLFNQSVTKFACCGVFGCWNSVGPKKRFSEVRRGQKEEKRKSEWSEPGTEGKSQQCSTLASVLAISSKELHLSATMINIIRVILRRWLSIRAFLQFSPHHDAMWVYYVYYVPCLSHVSEIRIRLESDHDHHQTSTSRWSDGPIGYA